MVFDGGGLTKMTIVPKGTGSSGASEEIKRVKLRGKLWNGEEIEYYPGELWILLGGMFPPEEELNKKIRYIESRSNGDLLFQKKVRIGNTGLLKFRVLNGRDPLELHYSTGGESAVNGLGPTSTEFPEGDLHVKDQAYTDAEILALRDPRKFDAVMMQKNSFLGKGDIRKIGFQERFIVGHLHINVQGGHDSTIITTEDVLKLVHDEGGILYLIDSHASGRGYEALFPALKTVEDHAAMIERLNKKEIFKRATDRATRVSPSFWSTPSSMTSDPLYRYQWYLQRIRAQYAWDIETGKRSVRVGVLDSGIAAMHEDLLGRVLAASAYCMVSPCQVVGDNMTDIRPDYHGTHVSGIVGAARNNVIGNHSCPR